MAQVLKYTSDGLPYYVDDGNVNLLPVELPTNIDYNTGQSTPYNMQPSTGLLPVDKLFGVGGQERYQTWPEKIVRSAVTLPADVISGNVQTGLGLRREDFTDIPPSKEGQTDLAKLLDLYPIAAQPLDPLIERSQDVAGLMGGAPIGMKPGVASVGSGAVRSVNKGIEALSNQRAFEGYQAAIRDLETNKIYNGDWHQEVLDQVAKDKNISVNELLPDKLVRGYLNNRGRFLTEQQVENLSNSKIAQFRSDTSKPGMALSAAENAPRFYSAVENAVNNSTLKSASPEQWLGTIQNAKGVKPEEIEWLGLKDFVEGKDKITKAELQDYVQAHKVELKEVNKGDQSTEFDRVTDRANKLANKYAKERNLDLSTEAGNAEYEKAYRGFLKELSPVEKLKQEREQLRLDLDTARKNNKNLTGDERTANINKMKQLADRDEAIEKEISSYLPQPTKYGKWQLPGGTNYREKLLTLPDKTEQIKNDLAKQHLNKNYNDLSQQMQSVIDNIYYKGIRENTNPEYRSSHWDEPNLIAHVRMNDRVIDGKKSLHLEEIQSDWHQQGRDRGYKLNDKQKAELERIDNKLADSNNENILGDPDINSALKKAVDEKVLTQKEADDYRQFSKGDNSQAVPDAPFKKSWLELAAKRMIREAAEGGYDRLSWTPGEAQAARYDLSKEIKSIKWQPQLKEIGNDKIVNIDPINSGGFHLQVNNDGKILNAMPSSTGSQFVGKNLSDVIGKEHAEKIMNEKTGNLKGEGLKIGGEGMHEFYNKMLPRVLEKIGKEHGVKVKEGNIYTGEKGKILKRPQGDGYYISYSTGSSKIFKTIEEAQEYNKGKKQPIKYIDIPQGLKDVALQKGFPLFSKGGLMLSPVEHDPFEKKYTIKKVDRNPFAQ